MKKLLLIIAVALGILSCSSCSKEVQPTSPCNGEECSIPAPKPSVSVPPPVDGTVKIQDADWSFVLPSAGWDKVSFPEDGVQIVLRNEKKRNLIIFVKEKFDGSPDQYALFAIRGLKDSGGTLGAVKQVTINDNKFVLVESSKGSSVKIWMWITSKSGNGYAFSCGGPVDELQEDLCNKIAESVKIK